MTETRCSEPLGAYYPDKVHPQQWYRCTDTHQGEMGHRFVIEEPCPAGTRFLMPASVAQAVAGAQV